MPIHTINHAGKKYPAFQASGNAARFVIPFAQEVCKGNGYDIGCNRLGWAFPGAIPIDPNIDASHDGFNLPAMQVDYIFSSHMLEHCADWVAMLDHWHTRLQRGGVLFLYLPDMVTQTYWRNWSNRKHVTFISPDIMRLYFEDRGSMWDNVFVSSHDLNNSFVCIAEKV